MLQKQPSPHYSSEKKRKKEKKVAHVTVARVKAYA